MASKAELAIEIFRSNPGMANTDFVAKLISDLGMTKLGARTYSYNVRKMFANGEPTPVIKVQKEPKAPKAPKEPKAGKVSKQKKMTTVSGSLNVEVGPDSTIVEAAKAIHKASYLSFMDWENLSQASRDEFIAQVKSETVEVLEAERVEADDTAVEAVDPCAAA